MELGDDTKALRGIHARGLGTIRGSLTITSSRAAYRVYPATCLASVFSPIQRTPSRSFCAIQPAVARDSRRCPTAMKSRPSALLRILTETEETAHDLLFINSPIFMTNDPVALVFQEDASALRASYAAARTMPSKMRCGDAIHRFSVCVGHRTCREIPLTAYPRPQRLLRRCRP